MPARNISFKRLKARKFDVLLTSFVEDLTATQAAKVAGVNRKTANVWYSLFRHSLPNRQLRLDLRKGMTTHGATARRLTRFYGISRMNKNLFLRENYFRRRYGKRFGQYFKDLPGVRRLIELR